MLVYRIAWKYFNARKDRGVPVKYYRLSGFSTFFGRTWPANLLSVRLIPQRRQVGLVIGHHCAKALISWGKTLRSPASGQLVERLGIEISRIEQVRQWDIERNRDRLHCANRGVSPPLRDIGNKGRGNPCSLRELFLRHLALVQDAEHIGEKDIAIDEVPRHDRNSFM